jgi:hypothetical protein
MKNIEITDSMIADYSAGWNHANNAPESQREPGDRRRAGLTAVVPEIIDFVLRRVADVDLATMDDVRYFAMDEFGIEL